MPSLECGVFYSRLGKDFPPVTPPRPVVLQRGKSPRSPAPETQDPSLVPETDRLAAHNLLLRELLERYRLGNTADDSHETLL